MKARPDTGWAARKATSASMYSGCSPWKREEKPVRPAGMEDGDVLRGEPAHGGAEEAEAAVANGGGDLDAVRGQPLHRVRAGRHVGLPHPARVVDDHLMLAGQRGDERGIDAPGRAEPGDEHQGRAVTVDADPEPAAVVGDHVALAALLSH